jgi:putative transposase
VTELHHEKSYPIEALCEIIKLNRSSYYKWLHRDQSQQEEEDTKIIGFLCTLYEESDGVFGYRSMRMHIERRFKLRYNKKRIYRLMRVVGMKSVIRKKRYTYIKTTPEVTAENILNRQFAAEHLNEKWLTDITEFKFGNREKAYLSAVLDLKDRSIISYVIGRHNNNQLVFDTFDAAVTLYPDAKPLFHSDRGFQYTNKVFKAKLDKAGMTQSMSRVGRCIDNGPMEGFWGTLKVEMYYLHRFDDYESLKKAIENYICYYNNYRLQEKLHCLAPLEYRLTLLNIA